MSRKDKKTVHVSSETGALRRLLVHSPDSGLGKVVPSKAQDWLFEDIVHLDTIRGKEYDYYIKILLYFLDPDKIKGQLRQIDSPESKRNFYKPGKPEFYKSDKVVELEWLLAEILEDQEIKLKLVASICAVEGCSYDTQDELLALSPVELAKVIITGTTDDEKMLFPPIPNFIFTRDIGIVINDYILLNKPAKKARTREALLAKYIFFNHPLFRNYWDNILEISDTYHYFLLPRDGDEKKVTLEGGDVMVVSEDHILVGVSERTTMEAAHKVVNLLFEKNIVKKVTVIKIPRKRDYMHIDTIFTQVKKNVWILLGAFSKKVMKNENADPVERILEGPTKKDDKIRKIDASMSVCMSVNNSLVAWGLQEYGTEEQKQKYLVPVAQGKKDGQLHVGAFLLSEPEAGSDATSQRTTAEDMGDHYILNGTKNWITNGSTASVYLVMAQTDAAKGSKGINAFIVEKSWPGVVVGAKENKLGIRGSDTHTILFNDVKVPKENRIGEDGFGFTFAMKTLSGGRIGIASQALGIASGSLELSLRYAKERKAFGKEIAQHQAIQFKLADMATRVEAARLLCLKAAWEKDSGQDYSLTSSMAKVYASETAMWASVEAVQIHGGYGFVKEYHVERLMRDAKITQIYEGTSEIQRIVISRAILK